jgi:hypothetical protein
MELPFDLRVNIRAHSTADNRFLSGREIEHFSQAKVVGIACALDLIDIS